MEIQAWFKIVDSQSGWDEVSLEGIKDVANLKGAIKKKMENGLKGYDPTSFTIKATYNDDKDPENAIELFSCPIELDPETKLKTVL